MATITTQWTVEIYKFQTAENHSYRAFWRKIISACLSIKFAVRVSALIDHYLSCFDIATIDWALIRRQLKIKSLKWSGNKTIFIGNESLVVGKLVSLWHHSYCPPGWQSRDKRWWKYCFTDLARIKRDESNLGHDIRVKLNLRLWFLAWVVACLAPPSQSMSNSV